MENENKKVPDFFENRAEKQEDLEREDNFTRASERLNFNVNSDEDETDENDVNSDAVPYDFRAEYKERISQNLSENTEQADRHFMSVKMHAIGIGVLIGVLVALLVSVLLFGSNESTSLDEEPIVIEESKRPTKVRPSQPGGMDIPDQDKTIYKRMRTDKVDTKAQAVVSGEEEPVRPQVKTKEGEILGKPQPAATAEEMEWEVLNLKDKAVQAPAPKVAAIQVAPVAAPVPPVVAKTTPAEEKPLAKSQEVIYGKPVAQPKATSPKAAPAPKIAANKWHVQLISMTSKAAVSKEWPKILKAHTALLSGLPYDIQEVDVKGKTFYRLRVGEFKNKKDAQNLCDKLKSRKQDCALTK